MYGLSKDILAFLAQYWDFIRLNPWPFIGYTISVATLTALACLLANKRKKRENRREIKQLRSKLAEQERLNRNMHKELTAIKSKFDQESDDYLAFLAAQSLREPDDGLIEERMEEALTRK